MQSIVCMMVAAVLSGSANPCLATGDQPSSLPFVYHTWERLTTSNGLPHDSIRTIRVVGDRIWVGTDNGLAVLDSGSWRSWTAADGLQRPMISAIEVDVRSDTVWLGTWGGGLIRFSGGRFDQFTQFNSGLSGDEVFAVAVEGRRLWVSTNGGISVLDLVTGDWELRHERRADTPETIYMTLSLDQARSRMVAASWCGPLDAFNLQASSFATIREVDSGSAALGGFASDMGISSLWWASNARLERQASVGTWESRAIPTNAFGKFVPSVLAVRSDLEAWTGGTGGINVLADWVSNTWVTYRHSSAGTGGLVAITSNGKTLGCETVEGTIPTNQVRCIAFSGDDVLIGTSRGLFRGSGRGRWEGLSKGSKANHAADLTACPGDADRPIIVRDAHDDRDIKGTVKIAMFGPITKTISLPGESEAVTKRPSPADSLAIQLAVTRANENGGYLPGIPFETLIGTHGYPRYGWGGPEDDLANFTTLSTMGIVAAFAPGQVTATATVLRGEVPIVNISARKPSIDEQLNPWMFRCRTDDPRAIDDLARHVVSGLTRGGRGVTLIQTPGTFDQWHLDTLRRSLTEYLSSDVSPGSPSGGLEQEELVTLVEFDPQKDDLDKILGAIPRNGTDVVATWAGADLSARILRRMRDLGMTQVFVGSDRIVCGEFVTLVGPSAGAVVALSPCPHRKDRASQAEFVEKYMAQNTAARRMRSPSLEAYLAYHATGHLLQAVTLGGLDRDLVREVLARMGETRLVILSKGRWRAIGVAK